MKQDVDQILLHQLGNCLSETGTAQHHRNADGPQQSRLAKATKCWHPRQLERVAAAVAAAAAVGMSWVLRRQAIAQAHASSGPDCALSARRRG